MSITDELRKYADKLDAAASRRSEHGFSTVAMKLTAIADRIDEALEGHIELPKDADGVTIHLGERVQLIGNDPSTVSHMHLADDGWRVFVKYDGGLGMGSGKPESIRHVQPDSWERIINELAERVTNSGRQWGLDAPRVTAEFVERCKRLAGEDE